MAFGWVHQAAHILGVGGIDRASAQARLGGLLGAMTRRRDTVGESAPAVAHLVEVTRSYWPGLFHCYEVTGLPRTTNALEQTFGSYRHHERRVTGRKVASPAAVLRGPARIIAAVATRPQPDRVQDLSSADRTRWLHLRAELSERRHRRIDRRRFRRDPERYLRHLEAKLNQPCLPP